MEEQKRHERAPERIIRRIVDGNAAGQSVRQFLLRELGLRPAQISRLKFSTPGIRVNGEKAYVNRILEAGDLLEVGLTLQKDLRDTEGAKPPKIWEAPPREAQLPPLEILYEDEDLLIVNKPAGIVCHPSPGHYSDTLANQAAVYLGAAGTALDIRVTGRLDRETSGIVTFARNAETAAALQRQRGSGTLVKEYLALTEGVPGAGAASGAASDLASGSVPVTGVIDLPLRREYPGSFKMIAAPDGKAARTFYKVLRRSSTEDGAICLLRCTIEHGRTHQIRVHLSSMGCPIVGDRLYGSNREVPLPCGEGRRDQGRYPGICLHARRLRLLQPFTGETIEIEAPLPPWLPETT
ncbi:MAG: RluA family pseudouridine synthase [Lachnospiraceae bacterium]|nr:RluA family pseudouridine synthase [Lachnospiraceae bacterium]